MAEIKLDKTFAREILKVSNGDGSREDKFAFAEKVRAAKKELSTPNVLYIYDDCIKKFGRIIVAICTAQTIMDRKDRLDTIYFVWAMEVLKRYTNAPRDRRYAVIDYGLHPTQIEEYAGLFIQGTLI